MLVKKFEAESLEQALKQVRKALGPQALILATQRKKQGLLGKTSFEVTAAFDHNQKPEPPKGTVTEDELLKIFPHRKYSGAPQANSTKGQGATRYVEIADDPETAAKPKAKSEKHEEAFLRLGLSAEASKELGSRLTYDYNDADLRSAAVLERTRMKLLSAGLQVYTPENFLHQTQWAVIGTAGAGRTSFLVKLSLYLRGQSKTLSLTTLDSRKVISQAEIATYAKFLKVPWLRPEEEPAAKFRLIDTPCLQVGMNQANATLSERLERMGAKSILVLDGTSRLAECLRVFQEATGLFAVEAIAVTKLDLAAQRGLIYDLSKKCRVPIIGVSHSQSFKVPFEFSTVQTLGQLILRKGSL